MPDSLEYTINAKPAGLWNWPELWRYRELFYFFTWRDIKIKYKQTVLGFLWAILQPLLMMVIFTLFFGRTLKIPSQNLPYPVYVFSGLLMWNLFASGLTNASNSMVGNASIIKKIYFPRLIIPVSSVLAALFDFLMAFVIFVVLLLYYRQPVSFVALLLWPAAVVASVMATLGMGTGLAALNVKYRDFRYVIPFVVQIMFFLSPVIYPVNMINYPALRYLLAASPMYAVIELFRFPLTDILADRTLLTISLLSNAILLWGGILYFRRTEDLFADLA